MPDIYEVEHNGETYEVEADSPEQAATAFAPAEPEGPPPFAGRPLAPNSGPFAPLKPVLDSARGAAAGLVGVAGGMGQLVNLADNALPGKSQVSPEDYKSAVKDLQTQVRGQSYEDAPYSVWMPEKATQLGVDAFANVGGKVKGFWGTVRQIAANSAIGSAVYLDDAANLADKAQSTALGTLAGVGLLGLAHGAPAGWHSIRKVYNTFLDKNEDQLQREASKRLEGLYPELSGYLTAAQKSGSQRMASAQATAASNYAQSAYRKQTEILKGAMEKYGAERYGPGWNPEEAGAIIGQRGREAARREVSRLSSIKKAEWDAMINSAEAAVTARKIAGPGITGSEQVMFDASNVDAAVVDLVDQFNVSKAQLAPGLLRMMNEIKTFKGQVSLETLLDVLKKTNADNFNPLTGQVTDQAQQAFGKGFRNALFRAIDDVPDGTSDAMTWVKRARASYRERSDQLEAFRSSATAKALGLDGPSADPAAALASISKATPAEQARMRNLLSDREVGDPELLTQLKGMVWRRSMSEAGSGAKAPIQGNFDPLAHAEEMLKMVGTEADGFSGLFSKSEAATLRQNLSDIRTIAYQRSVGAKSPDEESLATVAGGVLGSPRGSAPFVARSLYRLVGASDWAMFTPQGRAAVQRAYQTRGTPAFESAFGQLVQGVKENVELAPPQEE